MTKRAAVISDISSFGKCSLTASIAVLSVMGVQPCPLPTAVLSAQSEFEHYYAKDLTNDMPRFTQAWLENHERFDAVCTGYFASARQIAYALQCVRAFQSEDCALIVDPVMGDDGALYPAVTEAMRAAMKQLAAKADVLLPNLTELCWLADEPYDALCGDFAALSDAAKRVANGRGMIVTGIRDGSDVCNLVLCDNQALMVRRPKIGGRFSGTGDLYAAVVCGALLRGKSLTDAAVIAADFVANSIADTISMPHDSLYGVNFEQNLYQLAEVR